LHEIFFIDALAAVERLDEEFAIDRKPKGNFTAFPSV
jgi:hypothetical protein